MLTIRRFLLASNAKLIGIVKAEHDDGRRAEHAWSRATGGCRDNSSSFVITKPAKFHRERTICRFLQHRSSRPRQKVSIKTLDMKLLCFTHFLPSTVNHKLHAETTQRKKVAKCSVRLLFTALLSRSDMIERASNVWWPCLLLMNLLNHVRLCGLGNSQHLFTRVTVEAAKPPIATFTCHRFLIYLKANFSCSQFLRWSVDF